MNTCMRLQTEKMHLQVLKTDDPARVVDILRGSGFDVWEAAEAYVSNIAL